MNRKSGTLSILSFNGMENILALKPISTIVLGLSALVLVVVALLAGMPLSDSGGLPGISAGVEASSARWTALGAHFAPDYGAIATVNAARLNALGEYFGKSKARAADAARWNALGAHFAPDYEAIAAVNSARWSALGALYACKKVEVR